jgi:DNA mismatch repair ATPase MutS
VSAQDGPVLELEELAHALLPAQVRVGNSLALPQLGQICLITGSNMSGKSTFLRTAGLAVVMSRMGLPVPARSMRMRDMQVVTCMTVHDSLKDASSLFYAEVRRLRQCLDWAAAGEATRVLFDEILAGTNSRERHIGAVAILESLSRLPAVSLVSTHDLELGELAQKMPEQLAVVHFRDHVREGVMSFDYTLRPGVLPSTNALRVMRLAGLDVPER